MIRAGVMAGVAAALLVVPGPAAAAAQSGQEPVPEDDLSRFESAMVASGLSVVVERGAGQLFPEQDTTYTIMVRNTGEDSESVTVRASVPPGMSEVAPEGGGEVSDGFVEWPVTVDPQALAVMTLTGEYAAPSKDERAGGPVRVALTACALDEEDDQPIICATDISEFGERKSNALWWLLAAAVAVAVLAAVWVGFVWWRHRRRRPSAAGAT